MIKLIELFDVTLLPMVDMDTRELVDSKVVLAHPDAIVEKISCDCNTINILVKYQKENLNG